MPFFDAKADTPAGSIDDADKLPFGDVSADHWDTITFLTLKNQVVAAVPATTPGGSDTQLQYNNAGAFGGVTGFTWDGVRLVVASARFGMGVALPLAQLHVQSQTGLLDALIADAPAGDLADAAHFRNGSQQSVVVVTPTLLKVLLPGGTAGEDELRLSHTGQDATLKNMDPAGDIIVDAVNLTVRQPGGVAGTDEVQISHNGTDGVIAPASGELLLNRISGGARTDGLYTFQSGEPRQSWFYFAGFFTNQGAGFYSCSGTSSTADVGLERAAAATWKVTDGSTGYGAFQCGNTLTVYNASTPAQYATVTKTGVDLTVANVGSFGGIHLDTPDHHVLALNSVWKAFLTAGRLAVANDTALAWSSTVNANETPDTGLARSAAGVLKVTDGSTGLGSLLTESLIAPVLVDGASGVIASIIQGRFDGTGLSSITFNANDIYLARNAEGASLYLGLGSTPYVGFGFGSLTAAVQYVSDGVLKVTDGSTGYGSLQLNKLTARGGQFNTGSDTDAVFTLLSPSGTYAHFVQTIHSSAADTNFIKFFTNDGSGGTGFPSNGVLGLTVTNGGIMAGTVVEANTAGSGSPNVLTAVESRKTLTNEGATAENYHTLPTAAAGLRFQFVCQDADGIRVVADTGDTIRIAGSVSASAGYVRSSTVGSVLILEAINATEWVALSSLGTWTIDS